MSAKKYLNEERVAEIIDQIERRSPANFVGTTAQWNALTASQKAKYAIVDLVDDGEALGTDPVDSVSNNNMHAVTSNAVFRECRLREASVNLGDLTIGSSGYSPTDLFNHLPSGVTQKQIVFSEIANFTGTGYTAEGICLTNRGGYITGKPNGVIKDLTIRIYYLGHYFD